MGDGTNIVPSNYFLWCQRLLQMMADSVESRWKITPELAEVGGLLLATALLVFGATVSLPGGLEPEVQYTIAIFLFTIILWVTEAIPYEISSVLSVCLLYGLGVVESFDQAVSGYASSLVFFLFLLLLLGTAISKVGLDQRIASRLFSATSTPQESVRSLAKNVLGLSFFMPSAVARTATFIPIVREVETAYGLEKPSDFGRSSFLILGHVNTVASMALMTGGGMAIITSEVIQSSVRPITWVEWAIYMVPPTIVFYALSAYTAERFYSADSSRTVSDGGSTASTRDSPTAEAVEQGPMTRDQKIVSVVMAGAVIAWVIGSFIGLPTILPAVGAVTALALPSVGIITSDDLADVSWGILFIIGTMFSLLNVMEANGALQFIVENITYAIPFEMFTEWQTVGILLLLGALLRTVFSTASAALIVILPIILEFGSTLGVNNLYLAFSLLLLIGGTAFLPFNTTSVLLSFDQGPLTIRDVFVFGFIMMVYGLIVISLSWLLYWPLIG